MSAVQNVKFVTTQRGGDTLVIDNYMFRVRMRIGLKKYWKCVESTCKVTAVTDGGVLVKNPDTPSHNHASQELEVDRKEFKLNVLEEVKCIFFAIYVFSLALFSIFNKRHSYRSGTRSPEGAEMLRVDRRPWDFGGIMKSEKCVLGSFV